VLKVLGSLLRIYSYVFHLTLSVFLVTISVVQLSRHETWFEVKGSALLGTMELVCTLLGFTRWLRFLFTVAAAMVLYAAFTGFFAAPYMPGWIPSAASVAFLGALLVMFKSERSGMVL
jgi:hypothetical protein